MNQPKPSRMQQLAQLVADLEKRRFFGDVVLKFKDGQLAGDADVREVVKLDQIASRPG